MANGQTPRFASVCCWQLSLNLGLPFALPTKKSMEGIDKRTTLDATFGFAQSGESFQVASSQSCLTTHSPVDAIY
jgi:hypothetical protein